MKKHLQNETTTMKAEDSNSSKPNILDTIKLSKALRLAKQKSKDGQLEEAKNIYEDILQKFSKNKEALSETTRSSLGTVAVYHQPLHSRTTSTSFVTYH